MNDVSLLSSSTKPTNLSTMSSSSSISTMARSTASSEVATAASRSDRSEKLAGATPGGGEVHHSRLLAVIHLLLELLLALDLVRGHHVSAGGHVPHPNDATTSPGKLGNKYIYDISLFMYTTGFYGPDQLPQIPLARVSLTPLVDSCSC